MVTRATRSPRRRTVVALAIVLAVLAGFLVRLVDIQVVNAREHISQSMDHALGGSQTLYGTRGMIIDSNERGNTVIIEAEVPLSEMFGYTTELRSMSTGRAGSSSMPMIWRASSGARPSSAW